jgi:Fe-Mn family superoxide dismutase
MEEFTVDTYPTRKFALKGLKGISDGQLEAHFELYAGYVKNTNQLNAQLADLVHEGKAGTPAYSELTRRLGFEYNGMRLHELYFENLTASGSAPREGSGVHAEVTRHFRSFEAWRRDFVDVGSMRGVGWAILYQDPDTGRVSNHWITLHEHGHPAGFRPLLVMDVWEHAFMVDYKATERSRYIDAFFANVCWESVQRRFVERTALRRGAQG